MRKRTTVAMICLFILLITALTLCLFSPNITSSRFTNLVNLIKYFTGGQVHNQSAHTVTLYDWRLPVKLPAGQQSRAESIRDVDAIAIEGPTLINGKIYTKGILKFCDLATVTVKSGQINGTSVAVVTTDLGGWFCQFYHDYSVYDSIEQATPIYH